MPALSFKQWNRRRLERRRIARSAEAYRASAQSFQLRHPDVQLGPRQDKPLNLLHSGHVGDVIYALPTARALAANRPFSLYLKAAVDAGSGADHPTGAVRLNADMIERLLPLLRAQPDVRHAAPHGSEPIDVELDLFRDSPVNTERGSIARWYCAIFAISLDLSRPWLHADPMPGLEDTVILARSSRYQNAALDHRFLATLPRLGFVGIEPEFKAMRELLPSLEFVQTHDFLQLARVIKACRLFIGNQSSPFAVAEALKVRRILEVYNRLPNVIPEGLGGYEAWLQPQFEFLVRHCLEQDASPDSPT